MGSFHKACQQYARRFYPGEWFILSAKYGLLDPMDLIEDYDQSFVNETATARTDELAAHFHAMGVNRIISLGGGAYSDFIKRAASGIEVQEPFKDVGPEGHKGKIGCRVQAMQRRIADGRP